MSKKVYSVLVVTLLLLSTSYLKAATYTAKASGNWNNVLTWGTLTTPTSADIVNIPSGFTVTVNINNAAASALNITGTGKLVFNANEKLAVGGAVSNAGNITMNTGTTFSTIATLTNMGTVTVSTGTLSIGGNLMNSTAASTVTVGAGSMPVLGNIYNSGTITATTGTITVGSSTTNSGTLSSSGTLTLGGTLNNSGSLTAAAGGTLTFDGLGTSIIYSLGGTYNIASTVVINMGAKTTVLDVQDANFISGINTGGKYYFTFTRGTFRMDNAGVLNNAYNSGSTTALAIPYNMVIESDNGTMNLANKGTSNNVLLSGELLIKGGTVNVQTGQTNTVADFRYTVDGGTPQLYISSGSLTIGGGFNPSGTRDYIDFNMTGGSMEVTSENSSNNPTFQLQNVAGGKTFMSGGLISLDQPGNGNYNDLDMGGPALSSYSVTGGTVQFGGPSFPYNNTANFWIAPYNTTNYPNLYDYALNCGSVMAQTTGSVNALSLYISPGTTFDASNISTLNLTSSTGVYALDDEGTFTAGNNTLQFSGGLAQAITSSSLSNVNLYNLKVSNTSGNVVLGVQTTVANQLAFTSGDVDATVNPLIISNGVATTGVGNSSYVITGDGVTKTGYLAIQKLPRNATTTFPIGTSNYYLPVTLTLGSNTNTSYTAFVYKGVTTNGQANGTSVGSSVLVDMTDATWEIARTAGTGTVTMGLNWASAGTAIEGTAFRTFGTNIGITQNTGSSWSSANGTGSESAHTATAPFSSFGSFSVIGNPTALPLVLGNFNAAPQGKASLLTWAAFPDGQAGSFTIQRSLDGNSWSDIGVVQADVTAKVETNYSFTDVAPAAGQNDYRLYIQNEDGSTSYSSIRVVEFAAATPGLSVFPNPANSLVTVSIGNSSKTLGIRLVNTAGTTLQAKIVEAGIATVTMAVGSYPTGVYYLEVFEGGQLVQTTAVLVAH